MESLIILMSIIMLLGFIDLCLMIYNYKNDYRAYRCKMGCKYEKKTKK